MNIVRVARLQARFKPDFFLRNARGTCKERCWPRFKEHDLRDIGLSEVAGQETNISGRFARKKDPFNGE